MIRLFRLIFRPELEWDTVVQTKRSLGYIMGIHLLPVMLLASIAEGTGMVLGRKWYAGAHGLKNFTVGEAMVWELMQILLMLLVIALCAYLIRLMGENFNSRYDYRQSLTLVIYSVNPLFLLQFMGAIPWINLWVYWGIGVFISLGILYHGLPRILLTDPSHALGLYFISSIFLVLLTGAERLIFIRCLNGQGLPIENLVYAIAARLPF